METQPTSSPEPVSSGQGGILHDTMQAGMPESLSDANSIRGGLFKLREDCALFGGCHLAYEFMLHPNSFMRGDVINSVTLPVDVIALYGPSGAQNADPIVEKIPFMTEPYRLDIEAICSKENSKYYKNSFFLALQSLGCVSLTAYPTTRSGRAGFGAITIFETNAQRARDIDPEAVRALGQEFHNHICEHGFIRRYFKIEDAETFVLSRMAAGRNAQDIATELDVTPRTIELRLQNVRKKLNARTTTEAVYKAVCYGILPS